MQIKISMKSFTIWLLYILIAYLPFASLVGCIVPGISWLKDVICIIICSCVLLNGKLRINGMVRIVFLYTSLVLISILYDNNLDILSKINIFRYRCEYPITLCLLFSSFCFTPQEIKNIVHRVFEILFYTGICVASIGVIEIFNPSLIYSVYGDKLTSHLSLYLAGAQSTRLLSSMGNPINLGLQMCISIAAALYLLNKDNHIMSKMKKVIFFISIVLFIIITVFTYSRTAYLSIAVGFTFYYFARIFIFETKLKNKIGFIVLSMAFFCIFVVLVSNNQGVMARIGSLNFDALLTNTRYTRALTAFNNSNSTFFDYLFGHGLENVLSPSGQYVFEFGWASLLYELGVLGCMIFIFLILKSIVKCLKMLKYKSQGALIGIAYGSLILSFSCAMITEDVYFQLPFSLYFWLSVIFIDKLLDKYYDGSIIKNS